MDPRLSMQSRSEFTRDVSGGLRRGVGSVVEAETSHAGEGRGVVRQSVRAGEEEDVVVSQLRDGACGGGVGDGDVALLVELDVLS